MKFIDDTFEYVMALIANPTRVPWRHFGDQVMTDDVCAAFAASRLADVHSF